MRKSSLLCSVGRQKALRVTRSWSSCSKLRVRVGGVSWGKVSLDDDARVRGQRVTDEDAEVDGFAEGVVALDESAQGPACQRDPGEVFRVDVT